MASPDIEVRPPGQERPWPRPTSTGTIPFSYSKTGLEGETYYEAWGDISKSDKTPLICLHGGPGIPHNYIYPISLVYKDHGIPVLMYHQIGCGKSTHFKDKKDDHKFWTPELFMAELDNVKAHFGIKDFHLLGQSWGGMLAGQYAITQPQGLRKLVVSNSPSDMKIWVSTSNKLREKLPKDVRETLDRCERDGNIHSKEYEDAVMYFYGIHLCRITPWPQELADSFAYMSEDNTVYESMNGPSEFFVVGSLKDWNITEDLKKITEKTVPGGILVINGHYDEAQDETTSPYFYNPSCKTKWVRYALSSHVPMLEETERYVKDLGEFLIQ
jgi:proline-specific peptidase